MARHLSLAHLTMIHVSPPELVTIAARCGYRYVGIRLTEVVGGDAWPLISDKALMRETRARLDEHGIEVLDVELVRLCPHTSVQDYEAMLATAAELGARHVLTQAHDSEWNRLTHNFGAFCDLAAAYGMTADLEFLTWTQMRGMSEARALIDAVDRDNAGLMIDTLHFFRSGCGLEDIDMVAAGRFHYAQIADAEASVPPTTEGLIHTAREDRMMPGQGDLDLRGIISRLPADIPLAVEIPNSRLAAILSGEERAWIAHRATCRLLETL